MQVVTFSSSDALRALEFSACFRDPSLKLSVLLGAFVPSICTSVCSCPAAPRSQPCIHSPPSGISCVLYVSGCFDIFAFAFQEFVVVTFLFLFLFSLLWFFFVLFGLTELLKSVDWLVFISLGKLLAIKNITFITLISFLPYSPSGTSITAPFECVVCLLLCRVMFVMIPFFCLYFHLHIFSWSDFYIISLCFSATDLLLNSWIESLISNIAFFSCGVCFLSYFIELIFLLLNLCISLSTLHFF